jgi:Protein of unknown function (DUF2934)
MAEHTAVFGIYSTKANIEKAVIALQTAGFRSDEVSVLIPGPGSNALVTEKSSKAPEGAAMGAGSGAVVGAALGWLAGNGALALPGFGPLIAAGPIASALAGVGVGGTVGGITGALIGLGIPQYEAKRYEGHVTKGGSLISVHCASPNRVKRAKQIMRDTGAEDVSATAENSPEHTRNHQSRTDEPAIEHSPGVFDAAPELPSSEEIRNRAYAIYLARGGTPGDHLEDWLNAERELKEQYRKANVPEKARTAQSGS